MTHTNTRLTLFLALCRCLSLSVCTACASAAKPLRPTLAPMAAVTPPPPKKPAPLVEDLFKKDHAGSISEADLRRVLDAPVELVDGARLGVVPVAASYVPDPDVPLDSAPAALSDAALATDAFEAITEVSTVWPRPGAAAAGDAAIPVLRELAARYRADYLLLYRHRFEDRTWSNPWAWLHLTLVGGLMAPVHTLEAAGVLEATLFDVRTGTLLFTVFERVNARVDENVWNNDRKRRELKERLLARGAKRLSDQVLVQVRRLAEPEAAVAAGPATSPAASSRTPAPGPPTPAAPSPPAAHLRPRTPSPSSPVR